MCLELKSNQKIAKIATKDICTFKILKKDVFDGKLYSPFRSSFKWNTNTLYSENDMMRTLKNCYSNIHIGLHSCATYEEAVRYRKENGYPAYKYPIYMTEIPRGSVYWFNDFQYCSDRLILKSSKPYKKPRVKTS